MRAEDKLFIFMYLKWPHKLLIRNMGLNKGVCSTSAPSALVESPYYL